MARDFPDWINPWAAAEGRRTFQGTIPLQRFDRLAALLADGAEPGEHVGGETTGDQGDLGDLGIRSDDEVRFTARFALDEERRAVIDLAVDAQVVLLCQASLEPYRQALHRESRLGVIDDESEIKMLPDDYDPVLTDNGRLAIQSLVEDELLLALPQVPRKPGHDAVVFSTGDDIEIDTGASKPNPFATLREELDKKR